MRFTSVFLCLCMVLATACANTENTKKDTDKPATESTKTDTSADGEKPQGKTAGNRVEKLYLNAVGDELEHLWTASTADDVRKTAYRLAGLHLQEAKLQFRIHTGGNAITLAGTSIAAAGGVGSLSADQFLAGALFTSEVTKWSGANTEIEALTRAAEQSACIASKADKGVHTAREALLLSNTIVLRRLRKQTVNARTLVDNILSKNGKSEFEENIALKEELRVTRMILDAKEANDKNRSSILKCLQYPTSTG